MAYIKISGELLEPAKLQGRVGLLTMPMDTVLERHGFKLSNPQPFGVYGVEFDIHGRGIVEEPDNEVIMEFRRFERTDTEYGFAFLARVIQSNGKNSDWFELNIDFKKEKA